jgi:membrane associated rhomboid family serine protease
MGSSVRRGPDPAWMRPITDRLSPAIRILIIIDAALFAFYAVVKEIQPFFDEHLALGPRMVAGEFWQPITSLFVHIDFINFAFNVIGLWFVGATIERNLGTRRFLLLFFACGMVANLVQGTLSVVLGRPQLFAGCGNAVLGLFVAFGTIFDRSPVRVLGGMVMEARILTAILIGFAFLADLTRGAWANLAADTVVVILGYALAGGRGEGLGRSWHAWRARRTRRRYQVLEGGRNDEARPRRRPSSDRLN